MLNKIDHIIVKFLEIVMIISLIVTVSLTFIQVVFRYLLQISLPWSQEFIMLCFVYSIFSGAAVLAYKKEHLVVDLFDELNPLIDKLLKIVECVIAILVLVVFSVYGLELVQQNFSSGQTLGMLPIQRAYLYLAVPVSSLFMIYFYARRLIKVCFGYS